MSDNGPRRRLAAVLIRAAKDALDANNDLATTARGWLGAVGGDLMSVLDIPPARRTSWLAALPALSAEPLALRESQQAG